ncbi:hypothetical protein LCGC14_2348080, partial [marine sediment metagenome]
MMTEKEYRRTAKKKATAEKKKAPVKKKAPEKTDPKILAVAKEVLPAIREGEVTVRSVWRDRLKLANITPLRNAFIEILGSKKAWNEVLDGRPKATRGFQKGVAAPRVNDADVLVITSSKYADGWSGTTVDVHGRTIDVVISPDGVHYIRAGYL